MIQTWLGVTLMIGGQAQASAATMTAELNRTEGTTADRFAIDVLITGQLDGDVTAPTVPGVTIEKTGTSSNFSWINGKSSVELRYTYSVYPDKPGSYTIGSFRAKIDGKTMQTLPLNLTVKAGGPSGNNRLGQRRGSPPTGRNPRYNPRQQQPRSQQGQAPTENIFIEREVSNLQPYVGEQVISTIRIYHHNLRGGTPKVTASPTIRRIPIKGESEYVRNYQGRQYKVLELKEIIVPIKAGKVSVPPYVLQARIFRPMGRGGARDIFDMLRGGNFNFAQEVEVDVASDPLELQVKPLPAAGKPPNFSGLVGDFSVSINIQDRRIEVGDSTNLKVTVKGKGLLDSLGALKIPQLNQVGKIYPDAPELKENTSQTQGVSSTAVYSYAIVPEKSQVFELGNLELVTFNPQTERYETLSRPLGTLTVDPSSQQEKAPVVVGASGAPQTAKKQVEVLGEDLVGLHRNHNLLSQHDLGPSAYLELALFGGLPLAFLFLLMGWKYTREYQPKTSPKEQKAKALQRLQGQIQLAKKEAHQNPAQGLSEAKRGLVSFLTVGTSIPSGVVTSEELQSGLQQAQVTPELIQTTCQLWDDLHRLEYSGVALTGEQVAGVSDRVIGVATDLLPFFRS